MPSPQPRAIVDAAFLDTQGEPPGTVPTQDAGGVVVCPGGHVHLAVGANGGNYDFDAAAACAADVGRGSGAVAYFGSSGDLVIAGCTDAGTPSQGIRIVVSGVTGTGTYSKNVVSFVDRALMSWSYSGNQPSTALGWTTAITTLGPTGGIVEGTYIGAVSSGTGVDYLMGHFTVCRVRS